MTTRAFLLAAAVAVGAAAIEDVREAAAQAMPDPRQMSGMPLPAGDLKPGTVTVRVLRGGFVNPVQSQTVELTGAGFVLRATTNEAGRAEFSGVATGARVRASATVGGERLDSQEFVVPAAGGIRLMLVAPEPAGSPGGAGSGPAAAGEGGDPARGDVVLGGESRFVFEMGEDGLSVFYILQIVNPAGRAVSPEAPLVFELPDAATGATVLQGSSPNASVAGRRLQVTGPFQPGPTLVQVAYTMPITGPELAIDQPLPVALEHLAVVAQKTGDMQLASPQIAEQRTMPAQGNLYIAARGQGARAGDVLQFRFTGMPHHPTWPRNLAIGLGVLILAAGAWGAWSTGRRPGRDVDTALRSERDRLFDELAELESGHRERRVDPAAYSSRRRELVAALERVYSALDDQRSLHRAS